MAKKKSKKPVKDTNLYRVTVGVSGYKVYFVDAKSEEEAAENYQSGDCVKDESEMDTQISWVECLERNVEEPEELENEDY